MFGNNCSLEKKKIRAIDFHDFTVVRSNLIRLDAKINSIRYRGIDVYLIPADSQDMAYTIKFETTIFAKLYRIIGKLTSLLVHKMLSLKIQFQVQQL